jgi:hypothetical protein
LREEAGSLMTVSGGGAFLQRRATGAERGRMTELGAGVGLAEGDGANDADARRIGEYLAAHGGPFFELQRRLGVLREDALLAGRRAAMFVALARWWRVPWAPKTCADRALSSGRGFENASRGNAKNTSTIASQVVII